MAEQEPDIHNFSTSSPHRLPTISGTQALQNELTRARGIPTGLQALDQVLSASVPSLSNPGIRRGHVTEIFGPPGAGKTSFGIQVVVNAIRCFDSSSKVVWISTGAPLVRTRLDAIRLGHESLENAEPPSSPPHPTNERADLQDRLIYLETQSLPRLLTMLMHPTSNFPPPSTTAVVVDDLSNLILGSFPKPLRDRSSTGSILQDKLTQKVTSRRFQVIENLASALSRLAASRHLALIVLNNATTSLKGGQKALLKPALSGQAWDAAINTRIALYRDLSPFEQRDRLTRREKRGYRLAAVVRLTGREVYREAVPFLIQDSGLRQIVSNAQEGEVLSHTDYTQEPSSLTHLPNRQLPLSGPADDVFVPAPLLPTLNDQKSTKRKAIEIADSDGEDDDEEPHAIVVADNEPQLPALGEPDLPDTPAHSDEMLFETHAR